MSPRFLNSTTIACLALTLLAALLVGPSPAKAQHGEQRVGELDLPPEAERAISRGLVYLAANQNADGSWGTDKYYVANTSLSLMAFMVQGHVPGKGRFGANIDRGINYLLNRARLSEDGYITDPSSGIFYQHCLAVMALAEAWGQSKNPDIGPVVRTGAKIILTCQGETGGWRYSPQPAMGDISVTIMGIEALVSAKEAGVYVPDEALERAQRFLKACQSPEGFFMYMPGNDETNAYRMGAGLLGLALTGDRESERVQMAWRYLLGPAVEAGWAFKPRGDWLDQFYCVQACYQFGDDKIQFWYPSIAPKILRDQDPSGRIGHGAGLPHGSTAVAVLILGVPYRYLPIFQR